MRVLNRDLPSPIRDIDLGTLLRPNYAGFLKRRADASRSSSSRRRCASCSDSSARSRRSTSPPGSPAALPKGIYSGRGIERYVEEVLSDPDRTNDFRLLERELYLTATDLDTTERVDPRRGRVGRGADLEGGRRLGRAARDLRAGRDRRARVHRRRHPLDHQRRRRDRARGEVRRRHQPAGPLRQRLPEEHPDDHRLAGPARLRHGRSSRSSTRPSGCSPTTACTARSRSGRSATPASTSS